MFRLAPQSMATTFRRRPATRMHAAVRGAQSPRSSLQADWERGLTAHARSCPAIDAASRAIFTSASSLTDASEQITPFIDPLMRSLRTSARVSMPLMPGTPCDASHEERSVTDL
jgi:hypothetical protein